jgi:hypothetical protein
VLQRWDFVCYFAGALSAADATRDRDDYASEDRSVSTSLDVTIQAFCYRIDKARKLLCAVHAKPALREYVCANLYNGAISAAEYKVHHQQWFGKDRAEQWGINCKADSQLSHERREDNCECPHTRLSESRTESGILVPRCVVTKLIHVSRRHVRKAGGWTTLSDEFIGLRGFQSLPLKRKLVLKIFKNLVRSSNRTPTSPLHRSIG